MEQEIPVPACYFPPRLFWWYYYFLLPTQLSTFFVLLFHVFAFRLLVIIF